MARFRVYQNPGNEGYLIDVQADLMAHLNTRLVVPLVPLRKAPKPAKTLNPLFTLEGVEHVMLTQYAAAIPLSELEREVINLASRRDEIVAALDLLLQGLLNHSVRAALFAGPGRHGRQIPPRDGLDNSRAELPPGVDRTRAAQLGLTEAMIANNVGISLSSSLQTAPNFCSDPNTGVPYRVTVQTPEYRIRSMTDLVNIPLIGIDSEHQPTICLQHLVAFTR